MTKKKIITVIPCRVFSKRLFLKPLQNIGDFSILELQIKQFKKSKLISEVILAIAKTKGSELFIEFAHKNNLKYILGSEEDVLSRFIKAAKTFKSEIIVRITSENPFIFWEGIDDLIQKHVDKEYDLSSYANLPFGANFEIINLESLKVSHKNGNVSDKEHCTSYIYKNPKKFKILKLKPGKILERPELRLTVDTPQDLWLARLIYAKLGKNGKPIQLEKIIKFLDKNPKIKKINSKNNLVEGRFNI